MNGNSQVRPALDITDCPAAIEVLEQLRTGVAHSIAGRRAEPISIATLDAPTHALVIEALGEGEIRAEFDACDQHPKAILSETGITGVWRWQLIDPAGESIADALEPGDCPLLMRERPFQTARGRINWPRDYSEDTMDAVAVLAELETHLDLHPEIDAAARAKASGLDIDSTVNGAAHRINLSMLPQNPAAMDLINRCLGSGPARMVNSGYGRCQIEATAVRPIWRLRHFNNTGKLLLDSVEICPVPTAVLATKEDLSDSHDRLDKLLTTIGDGG
ncbi:MULTISPECIES: hydrogenase expression/formation C-terminal domain-containing protein [Thiorhodovibrio]|uniref:hydrogenase expression/formation C-terminal domain-containing protein n=1 Tax=Thiorhodovibrio TaxID=61593 RepID=UPI00191372EA|nr:MULTISPECIES: hydrogenase expression/formation C-terminal domain-containing protein [Thiorhodovibrio]WPL14342.1 hypothetical protein Thiosp_04185 [Thiorhodovibrio litoralis]